MKQGSPVELILKDGRIIGYFQYQARGIICLSMDSGGSYSWEIVKKDVKKIVEL